MSDRELPQVNQENIHKNAIHERISLAKRNHPDSVVIYFVRHKDAPSDIPKPTTPLVLFNRELKIQEVMYALFDQIKYKGLAFYVLKSEPNNKVRYLLLQPGPTIGKIFDEHSKNDYLALIYHNTNVNKRFSHLERRIIRFATVLGIVWIAIYLYPLVMGYLYPEQQVNFVASDFEEN